MLLLREAVSEATLWPVNSRVGLVCADETVTDLMNCLDVVQPSIAAIGAHHQGGSREKRAVTVRAQIGQPHETLRITVVVPDEGDDAVTSEYGVARTKDLAPQFGALP